MVSRFKQPDYTDPAQSGTGYPLAIDASINVLARLGLAFAPHAEIIPTGLKVVVDSGALFIGGSVIVTTPQIVTLPAADATQVRYDRVIINATTGAPSSISAAPGAGPGSLLIPSGYLPCALVRVEAAMTVVTDTAITDERTGSVPDQNRPAASGYVRVGPNLCMKISTLTTSSLTRDVIATLTDPDSNSKALIIYATATAKSANSIAYRYSRVQAYSNLALQHAFLADSYEASAISAGIDLSTTSEQFILVKNTDYQLLFDSDVGHLGTAFYTIRGYYD